MILYLDCASGVSGDMLAAALLDLVVRQRGGDPLVDVVGPAVAAIGLDPGLVTTGEVRRGGVAARAFTVAEASGFGTIAELVAAVAASSLPRDASAMVVAVATRLAEAEATVHGDGDEHLHELSDADTAVDLVSVSVLLGELAPSAIVASPPALGNGAVQTAHGVLSVPSPAVLELLVGWPTSGGVGAGHGDLGELTTPTGAALLAHIAMPCAALPAGRLRDAAYGAGRREVPGRPNVLRAVLIDETTSTTDEDLFAAAKKSRHVVLESNIDDMTPELLAHAANVLRAAGALDVWLTTAVMKKGRPGFVLHVLAEAAETERLANLVFGETSSFGLRVLPVDRLCAVDRRGAVSVGGCEIGVRLGFVGGKLVTASPEYEDVRRAAGELGLSAKTVYEAAQGAARARYGEA